MNKTTTKLSKRTARHKRIRARVHGTAERPRLAVFKSNRDLYVQAIDDEANKTLFAGDTRKVSGDALTARAEALGTMIAEAAKKANIEKVVFDRGGFPYQGVIATFAESARKAGLQF